MDESLRQAVYGAKDIAPTTADAEVNQAYQSSFRAPAISSSVGAITNGAQQVVEERKKAEAAAAAAAAAKSDPKNFQRLPKEDGGFAFFDGEGKEISAHEYARATGNEVASVLADSENPIDISYVNDYKNLRSYMTAWQNKDKEAIAAIQNADETGQLKKIKDPHELMKRFYQAYPTVYGRGGFKGANTAGQKVGTAFIPKYNSSAGNGWGGVDDGSGIGG
jgi:hypothetical protein